MATSPGPSPEPKPMPGQHTQRIPRNEPTEVLGPRGGPDSKGPSDHDETQSTPGPRDEINARCRSGHDQPNNPTWHRTLGLVPALSSVVFGLILLLAVFALEAWLLPVLIPWTIALLTFGLGLSALVQFIMGHRGWCWLWRTLRWWIGPLGTLIDPLEMG